SRTSPSADVRRAIAHRKPFRHRHRPRILVLEPLADPGEQVSQGLDRPAADFFQKGLELAALLALEGVHEAGGVDPAPLVGGPIEAGDEGRAPLAALAADGPELPHPVYLGHGNLGAHVAGEPGPPRAGLVENHGWLPFST